VAQKAFPIREVVITGIILLGFLIYGYVKMGVIDRQMVDQPSLNVGLVQGNIDQSIKWDESFQRETLKKYERLSLKVAEEKPNLIIWPETATPFFFQEAKEYQPIVLDIPARTNAFLLFGTPAFKIERGKINHYNSAFLASPSKELIGAYDKIHLVPFGEYVPLSDLLFFIGSLGEGIGNFKSVKGSTTSPFLRVNSESSSVSKSSSRISAAIRERGSRLFGHHYNDAWFGRTSAPYQHFAMASSGPSRTGSSSPEQLILESPESSIPMEGS